MFSAKVNDHFEIMNFAKKFLLLCCVVFYATLSTAGDQPVPTSVDRTEACFVEHLKAQGKLNETFRTNARSAVPCRPVVIYAISFQNIILRNKVGKTFSTNETQCLLDEFEEKNDADYIYVLYVIELNSLLSVSDKGTLLEEARNQFKAELKRIADHCLVDDEKFIQIYHNNLGIKNETLVAHQQEYCKTKYVVDNQIVQLNNVDLNPHKIDPESVNCDSILAPERSKFEREVIAKNSDVTARHLDCILKNFRNRDITGLLWASAVLSYYVVVPVDEKRQEVNKAAEKLNEYFVAGRRCRYE